MSDTSPSLGSAAAAASASSASSSTSSTSPTGVAAVAAVAFLACLPFVAVSAHSGDGAELVVAARHGAVLHPPGFPLQMWLDRFVVHVPFGPSDAWRVGLWSALGHALAIAFVVDALRRCGARAAGRVVGATAFGLFPACLTLGVQAEAFALAFAGVAASVDVAVAMAQRTRTRVADALGLGALVALCAAQHTITVVAAPAWLAAAVFIVARAERPARAAAAGVGAFAVVLALLYGSLLAIAGTSTWPDWGKLATLADLVRHMTRAEYGVLDLMQMQGAIERRGTTVLIEHAVAAWALLGLLVPLGAWRMVDAARAGATRAGDERTRARRLLVVVLGTLAAALAFLAIAVSRAGSAADADPTLERFLGTAVVPLAVLVGLGADALFARLPVRARRAETALAIVIAAALVVNAAPAVGAHADRTTDVVLEASARALPPDAVYFGATDLEIFAGVPADVARAQAAHEARFLDEGARRFPVRVIGGLAPWYTRQVMPILEPRLDPRAFADERGLVRAAVALGVPVAVSDDAGLGDDVAFELRGVLFVAGPGVTAPVSRRTIDAALALCPLIAPLEALPEGHGRVRGFRRTLARGYEGAAYALAEQGRAPDAATARAIAAGLAASTEPASWRDGCATLATSLAR